MVCVLTFRVVARKSDAGRHVLRDLHRRARSGRCTRCASSLSHGRARCRTRSRCCSRCLRRWPGSTAARGARRSWCVLSLLSRPLALALPVVLWLIRRPVDDARARRAAVRARSARPRRRRPSRRRGSRRRSRSSGSGARLTLAATAPWRYLWRTVWPAGLTAARSPRADAADRPARDRRSASAASRSRRPRPGDGAAAQPVLAGAWAAYLLLLVPAMGLVPSGLQATADRYTYLPGVAALGRARCRSVSRTSRVGSPSGSQRRRWQGRCGQVGSAAVAVAAVATLAALTWRQTGYWRDSMTLWTRAVEVDPRNDVALYNLGAALAEAGRRDEAIARYEQALAIVPDTRRGAPQPRPPRGGAAGGGRQRPCVAARSRRRDRALRRSGEARSPAHARAGRPRHGAHRARPARAGAAAPAGRRRPGRRRACGRRTRWRTRWHRRATRRRRSRSCVPRGSGIPDDANIARNLASAREEERAGP